MPLTKDQITKVIDAFKEHGTYAMAAKAIGISTSHLYQERKRNRKFRLQCNEAIEQGKISVGDNALTVIESIAFGTDAKDQQRLTAALALANAFIPGFRGVSKSEGHIQHDIKVITAVPRPKYDTPSTNATPLLSYPQDIFPNDVPATEVPYQLLPPPEDPRKEKHRAYMREYMRNKRAIGRDKHPDNV